MNDSTEGVTLYSGFVFDILAEYESMARICTPLFEMTKELDRTKPLMPCSMRLFNDVCSWIEAHLGKASVRDAGRSIGQRVYDQMLGDGHLGVSPSVARILTELCRVSSLMVQDPHGRGWEILAERPGYIRIRRTQTFNCILQEGLLLSLTERTGAKRPRVTHVRCTRTGAEYCEYNVEWHDARDSTREQVGDSPMKMLRADPSSQKIRVVKKKD